MTLSLPDFFKKGDLEIAKGKASYEALKDESIGKAVIYI